MKDFLFRCESIVLRSYWVLVVIDQFTRRFVGFGVQCGAVTGADVCRMFNAAIYGQAVPRHLSTDHDPVFQAPRWAANLRILEIDEIKTVPPAVPPVRGARDRDDAASIPRPGAALECL